MKKDTPQNISPPDLSLPLRYALYRRVSTSDQEDKDISLPAQRRQQMDFVTKAGGVVAFEFEDAAVSGRTAGRAAFQEAVTAAKARQYDVLLIHKSDRVFRSRDDAFVYKGLLKRYGVKLESVTEGWVGGTSPGEQLLEGVMECINEFYSANLSLEVKKGLREIAEGKGRQSGIVPYGYAYVNLEVQGSGWVVDEEEAAWVRYMFGQLAGGETLAGIARALNSLGVLPYHAKVRGRGKRPHPAPFWYSGRVGHILRSRVYLGEVQHSGAWFSGIHPPLVDRPLWDKVQVLMTRRGKGRTEQSEHGLFAGGLLLCPLCFGPLLFDRFVAASRADGSRPYVCQYRCKRGVETFQRRSAGAAPPVPSCEGFTVTQPKALALILAGLAEYRAAVPALLAAASALNPQSTANPQSAFNPQKVKDAETRRAGVLAEMSRLARMRQGYLDLAASGDMAVAEMRESLAALSGRQNALQLSLSQMETPPDLRPMTAAVARGLIAVLEDPHRTVRQKRDGLRLVVACFMLWPGKDGVDIRRL